MAGSIATMVLASGYLTNGVPLSNGQYTITPGSNYCSTCAAVSPSSGAVQNVWVTNPDVHVVIDSSALAGATINIGTVTATIGDGTVLTADTATVWGSTDTFASVYGDFTATRSTNALFNMLTNFSIVIASSSATFDTNFCLPTSFGTFCRDINTGGYWAQLVALMYWAVQAGALVSAYFIIHG